MSAGGYSSLMKNNCPDFFFITDTGGKFYSFFLIDVGSPV